MATLLHSNGTEETIRPKNGKAFDLAELQQAVGGYIEILRLSSRSVLVVNEEGRLKRLPISQAATAQYGVDVIVGDALVCTRKEAGF